MLQPLPPSGWWCWSYWLQKQQQIAVDRSDDHLGIDPGGSLGAAGLLVDPSLQGLASWQAPASPCGVSGGGCPFRGAKARTGRSIYWTLVGS